MAILDIQIFAPPEEVFGIFDVIDPTVQPATEFGEDVVTITYPDVAVIELGFVSDAEGTLLESLEVSRASGEPLFAVPEIGLFIDNVIDNDGNIDFGAIEGWSLALGEEDDVVDADGVLGGFEEASGVLPLPGLGDGFASAFGEGSIDFGAGYDILSFDVERAALTERLADGGVSIVTEDGAATALGLEEIRLADGAYLYGLSDEASFVYRLYAASLARTPDGAGLRYWDGQIASDALSGRALAQAFADSREFAENFLEDPSDEGFVEALYDKVLGRDAEERGRAFWLGRLDDPGVTRGDMLKAFADSQEFIELTAEDTDDGFWVV
jgi:hypothetical protein